MIKIKRVINETSINQKKRNIKNVTNMFNTPSKYNTIKSLVICTAENPDSIKQTPSFNKKANSSLLQDIKSSHYIYTTARGKFNDNIEHSYAIFNMSLDTAKYLNGKYQQTSFIYCTIKDNILHSEYYQKRDETLPYNEKTNDYILLDETDKWIDQTEADDNFTIIGNNFKYSIPFKIFENINNIISNNIKYILLKENKEYNLLNENTILKFTMENVGISPYLYRQRIIKGYY